MATRKSQAMWEGKIKTGDGKMKVGSGTFDGRFSFDSRFENGQGTNPEELIAAAHAGCFSMAFASILEKEGYVPEKIETKASVTIEKIKDDFTITKIKLETEGIAADIKEDEFKRLAEKAKENCPVSRVLAGAEISLDAKLIESETFAEI